MKAATTEGFGPNAILPTKEVSMPKIGADDVLIEVHASSVNPKDWKLNANLSSVLPKIGPLSNLHIIGDDLAGNVAKKGANVTGIYSGKNTELFKSSGADNIIDYTQGDYRKGKDKFDVIFDATAFESLGACISLMAKNGIFISTVGHGKALLNAYRSYLMQGKKMAQPVWVESYTSDSETLKEFIETGAVKPVIDSEYSLDKIEDAYAKSKTGRSRGKVVVRIKEWIRISLSLF
jgi:NADPH:quinone reductase-like Zn-dependent oxidoreductase